MDPLQELKEAQGKLNDVVSGLEAQPAPTSVTVQAVTIHYSDGTDVKFDVASVAGSPLVNVDTPSTDTATPTPDTHVVPGTQPEGA